MPARGKHVVYTPQGTTVSGPKGAKTFVGKGPGPAGTKKVKERSYLEAPTVTTSNGQVTTSGFSSPSKAQRAAARTRRTQTRVQAMVRRGAAQRKRSSAAAERQFKATEKRIKAPAYKPTGVSAMPSIKAASKQSERGFASEGNKPPVQVKAHTRKASVGFVPPIKPEHPRAIKQVTRQLKAAERSRPHVVGPLGPEQKKFVNRVAKRTHLSPRAIGAQAVAEEGNAANTEAEGTHNYLNIGPGRSYPTLRSGIKETSKLLNTSDYYAGIRASRGKGPVAQVKAIGDSPWGTSKSLIEQTVNEVGQKGKPVPKALLKKAAKLGLKSPDVSRGSGKTIKVRADAAGAVKWAEAQVGTQEGSSKQLNWAGKTGLGSTQPWCANFVSNDLLRRGIKNLPSNPNYVPSFEEEWGKYAVPLNKIKRGDLVTFSGAHIGIYVGNGEMVSGNSSDAVSRTSVGSPSMVIRPPYKGGYVSVKESTPLPGGSSPTASPSSSGAPVSSTSESKATSTGARLTPQQKYRRTKKALREVGIGNKQAPEEPSTTLAALEKKYGA